MINKDTLIIFLSIMILALFVSQLILLNIKLFKIESVSKKQQEEITEIKESVDRTLQVLQSYDFEIVE